MASSSPNTLAPHDWRCPVCSYPLEGLPNAACPECGRATNEAEQQELARQRQMPRNLQRIAQLGLAFTLVVWGWGLVDALHSSPRKSEFQIYLAAFALCTVAFFPSCMIYSRLKRIHARNETWSWIAAHATWFAPLAGIAILRFT